jgi:hypothetical protein
MAHVARVTRMCRVANIPVAEIACVGSMSNVEIVTTYMPIQVAEMASSSAEYG